MHHEKVSAGNHVGLVNLLAHDKRREHDAAARSNANIDPALTKFNDDLSLRQMSPAQAAGYAREYAQAHSSRRLRDNQVVVSEFVIHEPGNWRELYGEDNRPFFDLAVGFLRERYGVEGCANEVSAVVHRDEKALREGRDHLHWKGVPVTKDGRLSHKQVNGRADLLTLHDDFAEYLAAHGYPGLSIANEERELRGLDAKSMPDYQASQDLAREVERLREEVARMAQERDQAAQEAREAREEVSQLHGEVSRLEKALDAITERFSALVANIAEVGKTLHLRPWPGAWRKALEALADNPIAQAALDAGRRFSTKADVRKADRAVRREVAAEQREIDSLLAQAKQAQEAAEHMRGRRRGGHGPR